MEKSSFRLSALIVLLLLFSGQALSACNYPGSTINPTETPGLVETRVAQTIQAMPASPTNTLQPISPSEAPLPTLEPSSTPFPTEAQPNIPLTLAPTEPVIIPTEPPNPPTPSAPAISAQVNTNCRMGPGSQYPAVGALVVGQVSTVRGRDSTGQWWLIDNAQKLGFTCWVWSQTTSVQGDTSRLAVATAPPLVGASATVGTITLLNCGGTPTLVLVVRNTGNIALESAKISTKDLTNAKSLWSATSDTPFMGTTSECGATIDTLPAGLYGYMPASLGTKSQPGDNVQASVTLCSGENLSGNCITVKVGYVIP